MQENNFNEDLSLLISLLIYLFIICFVGFLSFSIYTPHVEEIISLARRISFWDIGEFKPEPFERNFYFLSLFSLPLLVPLIFFCVNRFGKNILTSRTYLISWLLVFFFCFFIFTNFIVSNYEIVWKVITISLRVL